MSQTGNFPGFPSYPLGNELDSYVSSLSIQMPPAFMGFYLLAQQRACINDVIVCESFPKISSSWSVWYSCGSGNTPFCFVKCSVCFVECLLCASYLCELHLFLDHLTGLWQTHKIKPVHAKHIIGCRGTFISTKPSPHPMPYYYYLLTTFRKFVFILHDETLYPLTNTYQFLPHLSSW